MQRAAAARQAEDRFEPDAIHPAGRAGVPRPSAPPGVRRLRVDVGRDDIGFGAVALGSSSALRVWVSGLSSEKSSVARSPSPSSGEGEHRPERGVRVLAAVLAHARHVALDVAGARASSCRTAASAAGSAGRRASPDARRPIPSPGARAPDRRRRRGRPTTARSRRCGTPCSPSTRAACRRRSRRGGTTRRPRPARARCSSAVAWRR